MGSVGVVVRISCGCRSPIHYKVRVLGAGSVLDRMAEPVWQVN